MMTLFKCRKKKKTLFSILISFREVNQKNFWRWKYYTLLSDMFMHSSSEKKNYLV